MTSRKPWQPRVSPDQELNPSVNQTHDRDPLIAQQEIDDPEHDSAPLQGSHDLSDADALNDVVADSSEPPRP